MAQIEYRSRTGRRDAWSPMPRGRRIRARCRRSALWDFGRGCNYGGERYDARLEVPGWSDASLDTSSWPAVAVFSPKVRLSAEMIEPNRRVETLKPVAIPHGRAGRLPRRHGTQLHRLVRDSHERPPGPKGHAGIRRTARTRDSHLRSGRASTCSATRAKASSANASTTPSAVGSRSAAWRRLPAPKTFADIWSPPIARAPAGSNAPIR